jgi:hypothetical protein
VNGKSPQTEQASRGRPVLFCGQEVRPRYCTVKLVDAVIPPELAPMVVVPVPAAVAKPATPGALAIVATEADDELQ